MKSILAGLFAAVFSWFVNRASLKFMGTRGIVVLVPIFEEAAKTGAAVLMGGSLIITHGIFGFVEGVYDAWDSGAKGLEAAAFSVIGHLFYGYVSFLVLERHGQIVLAILVAYIVHMLWNITVLRFIVRKRRPQKGES